MSDEFNDAAASLALESAALIEAMRCREARSILDRIGEIPDEVFLDIASLAVQVCQVPIAAVSLIDDTTAYFKGIVGSGHGWDAGTFTSGHRNIMVCNLTIKTPDQPCIIYDAELDDRVAGLPFFNGTYDHVRFHYGLPLTTKAGNAVGTICVFDRTPRQLGKDQVSALGRLRRLVLNLYGD